MDPRFRRSREASPERARGSRSSIQIQTHPQVKPIRRLQIVYYLARNGHLEHPHFMEITRFAHQPLRLRDVLERLTALRGKAMPAMYSWSSKRNYKNGYVWNDLAENDIIYPSDGAEYVLKGSELLQQNGSVAERYEQGNISNRVIQERNFEKKEKSPSLVPNKNRGSSFEEQEFEEEYETEEEFELDEEKTSHTSSTTPHSRCSRGVSTEELEEEQPHKNPTESTHRAAAKTDTLRRVEDGDPVPRSDSGITRNSVLLHLISCGNLVAPTPKPKNLQTNKTQNLQKEVLRKSAAKIGEEEDDMIISCMSENPRFGNLQVEDKEYFSGSIVESMSENRVVAESVLKRSNSYNEERGTGGNASSGSSEVVVEDEKKGKAPNVKRIPRKKPSSKSNK